MHEIIFNESDHTYTVDGILKTDRSVTQVLKAHGIVGDYSGVDDYYRDRGERVHLACQLHMQGWLDETSVAEDILPYLNTFKGLVEALGLSYVSAEEPCYDAEFDVCGKYDLIAMRDGKRTLVELKTGAAPMWIGLQVRRYEAMTNCEDAIAISLKDGKVYVKDDNYSVNDETWEAIGMDIFNLAEWKSNKKRRGMKVLRGK